MSDIIRGLTNRAPKRDAQRKLDSILKDLPKRPPAYVPEEYRLPKEKRPPKEYMQMQRNLRYSPSDQDMKNLKIGPMVPYPEDDPPPPLPKIEGVPEMGDPSDKLPPEAKKWKLT